MITSDLWRGEQSRFKEEGFYELRNVEGVGR